MTTTVFNIEPSKVIGFFLILPVQNYIKTKHEKSEYKWIYSSDVDEAKLPSTNGLLQCGHESFGDN